MKVVTYDNGTVNYQDTFTVGVSRGEAEVRVEVDAWAKNHGYRVLSETYEFAPQFSSMYGEESVVIGSSFSVWLAAS